MGADGVHLHGESYWLFELPPGSDAIIFMHCFKHLPLLCLWIHHDFRCIYLFVFHWASLGSIIDVLKLVFKNFKPLSLWMFFCPIFFLLLEFQIHICWFSHCMSSVFCSPTLIFYIGHPFVSVSYMFSSDLYSELLLNLHIEFLILVNSILQF